MIVLKDPDATLDYYFNWTDWLAQIGETIATSSVTVPAGLTKESESDDGQVVTVWLSGGTAGERYEVVNSVTTTGATPREEDRTMTVLCVER